MRLSARADYALRAAIELAAAERNHITAEQLARAQDIPWTQLSWMPAWAVHASRKEHRGRLRRFPAIRRPNVIASYPPIKGAVLGRVITHVRCSLVAEEDQQRGAAP